MDSVAVKTWADVIGHEKEKAYFKETLRSVEQERRLGKKIYPPSDAVFRAFSLTPFESLKVVIIGQDPYHGPNQAMGLCFSVNNGLPFPPSLRNIFKELQSDQGILPPKGGDLSAWAKQGVLMLNATLTVEDGQPQSHANFGWQTFTDNVISAINQHPEPVIYVLWGAYAQKKAALIDVTRHGIVASAHPSPLSASRGFFGSKPFSTVNAWLTEHNRAPIDWDLE